MRSEEQSVKLARKIVELDLLRDELLEELICLAGNRAFELLRVVQNS
ncbi:hypothetical protein [Ectobacillus ponti]|uniref:Uncharacterized protein n=1 Tax=Ectobacillus ponti TaxID=2961894 RepID=A0AA41X656_9BACI|nr:hypothetical protein [Ectobacillus ponti]MCP8967354.1 hypothetical protein [Ectobacillus ponti]